MKPTVARAALAAGASLVNDIAANRTDLEMARVIAETGAGYILMHMQGTPQTMQQQPVYADVVPEVSSSFGRKRGTLGPALVLDEKKLYPDSCGLRVMIMDGGAGFKEIRCCGHSLSLSSIRDLKYGGMRGSAQGSQEGGGTA